jgi:hypothetical protein
LKIIFHFGNFKVELIITVLFILLTIDKEGFLKMINWQVLGQLIATSAIILTGPAVIILLALKRGNL